MERNEGQIGPLERAWRTCHFPTVAIAGLARPRLITREGFAPCALLPAEATGWAREAMFAWLMLDLERRHSGGRGLNARLARYDPPQGD